MPHAGATSAYMAARERLIVGVLLAVWLAHVLAYVWLVSPWQHYDEPTHFEYAALIRERGDLSARDEHSAVLRRAIAESMIAAGFYANRTPALDPPDLNSSTLSIGIDERDHPPLYYALVALAIAPLHAAPITTQLYAARLFSVVLAGLLFVASYVTLRLLTGDDWILRCATLAVLALQPAFADIMSAVNSDVLANLVAVLCLLAGCWFLRRPCWQRLLVGLPLLLIAFNVKRVLLVYALILPCAWMLVLPRVIRRGALITVIVGAIAVCIWLGLQPWSLAAWSVTPANVSSYVSTRPLQHAQQPERLRTATPYAGAVAFALETRVGEALAPSVSQRLYATQLRDLAGTQLTMVAWMRADKPTLASSPVVLVDQAVFSRSLQLGSAWQRVMLTVHVPQHVALLEVRLPGPAGPGIIWYDALALVVGGPDNLPGPNDPDASFEAGLLGEHAPPNLLRNAGAERQIPPLPSAIGIFGGGLLDETGRARVLDKLFDPGWIAAVYPRQALLLFQGFWGIFGWGERSVNSGWFVPLGVLVVASLIGAARLTWCACLSRRMQTLEVGIAQPRMWWLCLWAVVLGWGAALLRVHSQPFPGVMFWSFGRYAFVALLPSLLLFVAGLRALLPRTLRGQGLAGVITFLLVYALAALLGTINANVR